jgi:hypothetical protein
LRDTSQQTTLKRKGKAPSFSKSYRGAPEQALLSTLAMTVHKKTFSGAHIRNDGSFHGSAYHGKSSDTGANGQWGVTASIPDPPRRGSARLFAAPSSISDPSCSSAGGGMALSVASCNSYARRPKFDENVPTVRRVQAVQSARAGSTHPPLLARTSRAPATPCARARAHERIQAKKSRHFARTILSLQITT